MREIKFRGKRIDTNEWAYGNYIYDKNDKFEHKIYCIDDTTLLYKIIENTIRTIHRT